MHETKRNPKRIRTAAATCHRVAKQGARHPQSSWPGRRCGRLGGSLARCLQARWSKGSKKQATTPSTLQALGKATPKFDRSAPEIDPYHGMSQAQWTITHGDAEAVLRLFDSSDVVIDEDFIYLAARRGDVGIARILAGVVCARVEYMILWSDSYGRNSLHLAAFANNMSLFVFLLVLLPFEKQQVVKKSEMLKNLINELKQRMYYDQGDYLDMIAYLEKL